MASDLLPIMELPIVPLRTMVLFPHAALPMTLNRPFASSAVSAAGEDGLLAVVTQAHPEAEHPGGGDLYAIGTGADIGPGFGYGGFRFHAVAGAADASVAEAAEL